VSKMKIWETYEHIKSGVQYRIYVKPIINATNANDQQIMVLYVNESGQAFVREINEFKTKFRRVE